MDTEMKKIANAMLAGIAKSYGIETSDREEMVKRLEEKQEEETDIKKKNLLSLATGRLAGLERAKEIQDVMLLMVGVIAEK